MLFTLQPKQIGRTVAFKMSHCVKTYIANAHHVYVPDNNWTTNNEYKEEIIKMESTHTHTREEEKKSVYTNGREQKFQSNAQIHLMKWTQKKRHQEFEMTVTTRSKYAGPTTQWYDKAVHIQGILSMKFPLECNLRCSLFCRTRCTSTVWSTVCGNAWLINMNNNRMVPIF